MKRFKPVIERFAVLILLASSSAACLSAARFGSAGLLPLEKQEAGSFQAMFWFVGVLLALGAVGLLWNIVILLHHFNRNNSK